MFLLQVDWKKRKQRTGSVGRFNLGAAQSSSARTGPASSSKTLATRTSYRRDNGLALLAPSTPTRAGKELRRHGRARPVGRGAAPPSVDSAAAPRRDISGAIERRQREVFGVDPEVEPPQRRLDHTEVIGGDVVHVR